MILANKKKRRAVIACLSLSILVMIIFACGLQPTASMEKACFAVFEDYFADFTPRYISVVINEEMEVDANAFFSLADAFIQGKNTTLLRENVQELTDKGYIDPEGYHGTWKFTDGLLVTFEAIQKIDVVTLKISVGFSYAGLAGTGKEYTVKIKGGVWEIINAKDTWIS